MIPDSVVRFEVMCCATFLLRQARDEIEQGLYHPDEYFARVYYPAIVDELRLRDAAGLDEFGRFGP